MWEAHPFVFEKEEKELSDFPLLMPMFPAISARALTCLRKLIEPYVEIFPLNIINSEKEYFGLNVLKIYDIDYSRSVLDGSMIRKSVESLYCTRIITHTFPGDVLPESPIFRTRAKMYIDHIFVSTEFRSIVEHNKLTGFEFIEEMHYRIGPTPGEFFDWNGRVYKMDSNGVPLKYGDSTCPCANPNNKEPGIKADEI